MLPKRGPLGAPQISTRYTVANENNAPKATPNADYLPYAVRCVGLEKPHGKRLRLLGGPTPTSLKLFTVGVYVLKGFPKGLTPPRTPKWSAFGLH